MGIHTSYHDKRDPLIAQARRDGVTYSAIGNQWGITGSRARQICQRIFRWEKYGWIKNTDDETSK